eukprot:6435960-Ditylum_brightwellii.AAC.1
MMTKIETSTWKPSLKTSKKEDSDKRRREDHEFEILYKTELDEYMQREHIYKEGMIKAYALFWERCAKAMKNKILLLKNYNNQIYNKPISLLEEVKKFSLNYQETKYEMSIISNALRAMLNARQKENEHLQDYTRRFKSSVDILLAHMGGTIILPKYVMNMEGYDASDKDRVAKLQAKASEQLCGFIYMENLDQ